jgi:hypothetical protein
MTTQRPPRPDPAPTRPPRSPREAEPNAGGSARVIAVVALVIAAAALGLAAWRFLAPATAGCQTSAWDTTPKEQDLPDAWTVSATQYDLSRKTMSFLGPTPADDTSSQGVIYATVTCFDQGADDSVKRAAQAATDAGQSVIDRDDLGNGGFSAVDDTGAIFLQLRHDKLVVYLAGSGDTSATEVDQVASAFDKALGGDGGAITPPTPESSDDLGAVDSLDPGASEPVESPAAPELVARLPEKVGDVTLTPDSASGSTILGEDQGSRAILAALRAAGREPDDLRVAQAYDDSGNTDLSVLVVTVDGLPIDKTKDLVLESWLSATGPGVTRSDAKLAGKDWVRIDYGDEGTKDYLRTDGDDVIVITTSDPAQAEQTAAGIK